MDRLLADDFYLSAWHDVKRTSDEGSNIFWSSQNVWPSKEGWPSPQKEYFVEFATAHYFKLPTTQRKPGKCMIIKESQGEPGKLAFFYF